eukprot:449740-Amphidinium_carterae.1
MDYLLCDPHMEATVKEVCRLRPLPKMTTVIVRACRSRTLHHFAAAFYLLLVGYRCFCSLLSWNGWTSPACPENKFQETSGVT